jgi:hypothetical protein
MGINDRGDIIVYKEGRTIFLHNDNYVVPEPATMLLFSLGGLAFGIVRRKKPL